MLAVVASAVISPWALSLTLLIAQKERDRIHHEVDMSVRTGTEHKYLEVDICCVNRWGLVDGLIDKVSLFSLFHFFQSDLASPRVSFSEVSQAGLVCARFYLHHVGQVQYLQAVPHGIIARAGHGGHHICDIGVLRHPTGV